MEIHIKRLGALAFVIVALIVFLIAQSNPSFFLILPILILLLLVSWYLSKEIQKDNEENLKSAIHYMQEEKESQVWLHKSFVPKVRTLAKKEMRTIILGSGILLMSFIFLWSFFIEGFLIAIINTAIGLLFFVAFVIYSLYTPKEFSHLFKHLPRRYRHHSKNDWVHGYLLLLPFAILCFFLYSLTITGEGITADLISTFIFLFSYTILFISIYCLWFLYQEYQREVEETMKKEAKKILNES